MALLDKNGQLLKEYQYTAFGIAQNPPDFNPWRFASKHYDSETHLVYFGRRYYDPVMGRWTTPDPADYSDGPNLYTYLQNNPLIYIDGYGLFSLPSWQDAKDVGYGLRQGAERLGQGIGHSITSSGEWLNADFDYEYGGDASSFRAKSQQSAEEWSALGQAFKSNPMQTAGSTLIPGIMDIINLPANATRSETLQAYGRGAFDVLTFFVGSKVGSVNKTGIVARETLGIEGSICQKLLKNSKPQVSNVDLVINETLQRRGRITSQYKLSVTEALEAGEKFLGKQYREMGEPGSGVFRSNDNLRQFRMDVSSLEGKNHKPYAPHVHLEIFKPKKDRALVDNHILIGE